ncbi:MAG: hypothetical protein CMP22_07115 [Rickettsiales bacterium]|nr:hypothetical protein [Rickettsiales bacterium]
MSYSELYKIFDKENTIRFTANRFIGHLKIERGQKATPDQKKYLLDIDYNGCSKINNFDEIDYYPYAKIVFKPSNKKNKDCTETYDFFEKPFSERMNILSEFLRIPIDEGYQKHEQGILKFVKKYGPLEEIKNKEFPKDNEIHAITPIITLANRIIDYKDNAVERSNIIKQEKTRVLLAILAKHSCFRIGTSMHFNKDLRTLVFEAADLKSALIATLVESNARGIKLDVCQNIKCNKYYTYRKGKRFCSDSCRISQFNRDKKS